MRTVAGEPGDVFLLCSDGLSSMVPDDGVVAAVEAAGRDPGRAAEALVAAANARGGEDNITVVIFELVGGADEQAAVDGAPPPPDDTQPDLASGDGSPPDEPVQESADPAVDDDAAPVDTTRHGAGPGGRIAAIALLAALLVLAALALYAGITR